MYISMSYVLSNQIKTVQLFYLSSILSSAVHHKVLNDFEGMSRMAALSVLSSEKVS